MKLSRGRGARIEGKTFYQKTSVCLFKIDEREKGRERGRDRRKRERDVTEARQIPIFLSSKKKKKPWSSDYPRSFFTGSALQPKLMPWKFNTSLPSYPESFGLPPLPLQDAAAFGMENWAQSWTPGLASMVQSTVGYGPILTSVYFFWNSRV